MPASTGSTRTIIRIIVWGASCEIVRRAALRANSAPEEVEQLLADLAGGDPAAQIAAAKRASAFSEVPEGVLAAAFQLYNKIKDEAVRTALQDAGQQMLGRQPCYRPEEVARIKELSELRVTKTSNHAIGADGVLRLPLDVAANGANFIVIEPVAKP